jgi:hypothetical protein
MKLRHIIPALMLSVLCACTTDFIEPNLAKKDVTLLSPPDNFTTVNNTVQFWWEEVRGASGYRIQVVDSTFTYTLQLMTDSVVEVTTFTWNLAPGYYQWRVRAENSSSHTPWSPVRTLIVDTTSSISSQTVLLLSPAANFVTNQQTHTFKWTPVTNADDYRFQVINNSNQAVVIDVTTVADSVQYSLSSGSFTWQVRAQNSSSNTVYSSRTITVDLVAPNAPVPVAPANGDTLPNPVSISWTRDASAVGDSLLIYPDSLISAPVYFAYHANPSHSFTGTANQVYFWRVKSKDAAGNWSAWGTIRKFRIQ